ncbi:FAD-dependent oxidoreductase [Mangrovibacter plantisponsor]|uniref:FAD dependent oxidoreductase n=1 Tax=Mangrovibacter plantisponsor TaxID=451513 RepID=A0A317Q4M1_9ENTR|nr:FAD-dependent oxidoreductase [Mangrovibacter plantisponsor]PWW11554.1 FAD dependent oxidoreductase [Mangrovibacter plantisponsor]
MKILGDCPKVIIAGGGFFGLYLAEQLSLRGVSVILIEKEDSLMSRASFNNQARVHNGYHYPRSILTAMRSRLSFPRFVSEFKDCIVDDFDKYYLVAGPLSKVNGEQFYQFCKRIGAHCETAPSNIKKLVNPGLVEEVFATNEYAFDSHKLRDLIIERLSLTGAEIYTSSEVLSITRCNENLVVHAIIDGEEQYLEADHVFNCTYSCINNLLHNSSLKLIPLRHEMTEMCLITPPEVLKNIGITVMCGPFFSAMPFPSLGFHSLSHVRYTPHYEWNDVDGKEYQEPHDLYDKSEKHTAWRYMISDAKRYIPIIGESQYHKSLWEVKTILPRSDSDDSRPILFKANYGLKGLHCIMGGKIDNIYDVIEEIDRVLGLGG